MLNFNSYDECKAVYGKTIETPIGPLKVCGAGMSGDRLSLSFGEHAGATVAVWSSVSGFETIQQRKVRVWDEELMSLKANELELLNLVFAARITADDRHSLKQPRKLVDVAKRQLIKAGKLETQTCTRCYGSGNYSFNLTDGSRCFGCAGSGKKMPTTCEAIKAAKKG